MFKKTSTDLQRYLTHAFAENFWPEKLERPKHFFSTFTKKRYARKKKFFFGMFSERH